MGRGIVKMTDKKGNDYYCEWSSIVDAPVTYFMTLSQLKEYIKFEYGNKGLRELEDRLERVDKYGTSFVQPAYTLENLLSFNRAGKDGRTIRTVEGFLKEYKD